MHSRGGLHPGRATRVRRCLRGHAECARKQRWRRSAPRVRQMMRARCSRSERSRACTCARRGSGGGEIVRRESSSIARRVIQHSTGQPGPSHAGAGGGGGAWMWQRREAWDSIKQAGSTAPGAAAARAKQIGQGLGRRGQQHLRRACRGAPPVRGHRSLLCVLARRGLEAARPPRGARDREGGVGVVATWGLGPAYRMRGKLPRPQVAAAHAAQMAGAG